MSFKFKNYIVSLENYREIFKDCTPDILDEIRSAILDDTQIGGYIKDCGKDSYKLGQIRMALREFVPPKFLNVKLTARTIYLIRQTVNRNLSADGLMKYVNNKGLMLDADTIEKLAEVVYLGIDISKVDFTTVPKNLVSAFCKGLCKGYPMWLCNNIKPVSEEYVILLQKGMSLGVDIHPFLNGDWGKEQLRMMFIYADTIDLNEMLKYVTPKFDEETIQVLIDLMQRQIPIIDLAKVDVEGYPIYNPYQIEVLGSALVNKVKNKAIFNPDLSDVEMKRILDDEISKKISTN